MAFGFRIASPLRGKTKKHPTLKCWVLSWGSPCSNENPNAWKARVAQARGPQNADFASLGHSRPQLCFSVRRRHLAPATQHFTVPTSQAPEARHKLAQAEASACEAVSL